MLSRIGVLVFLLVAFGPAVALVAAALSLVYLPDAPDLYALLLPSARQGWLLARTVALGLAVAVMTTVVGLFAASVLSEWRRGALAYARWLFVLLLVVPPYVHALAWQGALSWAAATSGNPASASLFLSGWPVALWVEVMVYLPLATGLALLGLLAVEPSLVEAARLSHPDGAAFLRAALPLAWPQLSAAAGLIFLFSITDYGVPSLFQVGSYSLEIFAYHSGGGSAGGALWVAVPLLAAAIVVLAASCSGVRATVLKPIWGQRRLGVPLNWPLWWRWGQGLALVLVALQLVVPLVSLAGQAGSWRDIAVSVASAAPEVQATIAIALAAGLLCLPLGYAVADRLDHPGRHPALWWLMVLLPLAIPAPLVGIGLIVVWNRPLTAAAYGSLAMPVLVALARFTPVAVLVLLAQLKRVDPLLIDAARVLAPNGWSAWLRVRLPLIAPGLAAAACLVAALSAGELGATLIVAPPGQGTLAMRIYNYLHYGASEEVAGLCLLMTCATVLAALAAGLALAAGRRISARGLEASR